MRDPSDEQLRAGFAARLAAAPQPSSAMRARTLAAIAAGDAARVTPGWRSAARWWSALAAPARFATAAAIVVLGGSVAFGTFKVTHDRAALPDAAPATRITLDRESAAAPAIAHKATLELTVRDVGRAARSVGDIASRAGGAIVSQRDDGSSHARVAPGSHIVLHVPVAQLDATLADLAALGSVRSRSIRATDITALLASNARALAQAQRAASVARIAQLQAARARLHASIAQATIAVILRSAESGASAFTADPTQAGELPPVVMRPTSNSLTADDYSATHTSNDARHRLSAVAAAACGSDTAAASTGTSGTNATAAC
jgi:hypothetical protein